MSSARIYWPVLTNYIWLTPCGVGGALGRVTTPKIYRMVFMKLIWKNKLVPKSFANWTNYLLWNTYYYSNPDSLKLNMAIKHAIKQELIARKEWKV